MRLWTVGFFVLGSRFRVVIALNVEIWVLKAT